MSKFIENIKLKWKDKSAQVDSKVNPKTGNKLFNIFSKLNLIWIIVFLPICVLVFAATLKPNIGVNINFTEIQSQETLLAKNVESSAGTDLLLGTVAIESEVPLLDSVFDTDYTIGTSTYTIGTELTGALTIVDNEQEVTLDGVDGSELSIYATPSTDGVGINYSLYELWIVNDTDVTYHLDITSDPTKTLIDLSGDVTNATFTLNNIDNSFINTEIDLGWAIGIFSTWIIIEIIILIIKWYFSKWEYYVEVEGGTNE